MPDITKLVTLCALDIICETSMGKSVHAQQEAHSEYVMAVLRINDIIHRRQKNPVMWIHPLFWLFGEGKEHAWALNILHSFTRKVFYQMYLRDFISYTSFEFQFNFALFQVINERREMRKQEGPLCNIDGRLAFLDLLLKMEKDGHINAQDIQNEA